MDDHPPPEPTPHDLFAITLAQLDEDAQTYDMAVESFNVHLDNHKDRRSLDDLPLRSPVTGHDAWSSARRGDRTALESVLMWLLEQPQLDSAVRRHPRVYPIHRTAIEHLAVARNQLVETVEDGLRQFEELE